MCVGLSAKVVKINEGTAIVDAGGAKKTGQCATAR